MPLVFTASSIISCIRGVKRCVVLFFFDRTCEHELARACFWTERKFLAERKGCQSYVREGIHRCFGFLHRQGAFKFTKREIILARDQNKALSGTLYVVEILFTLGQDDFYITKIHLRNLQNAFVTARKCLWLVYQSIVCELTDVTNSESFCIMVEFFLEVSTDHLSGISQCFVLTCVSHSDGRPFLSPSRMYRTLSS